MRRLIGMLLGCVTFSISAVFIHNAFLLNDYRATASDQKVEILIEPGDSGTEIAQKLYKSGVIKASKVFYKICIPEDFVFSSRYYLCFFTFSQMVIPDVSCIWKKFEKLFGY